MFFSVSSISFVAHPKWGLSAQHHDRAHELARVRQLTAAHDLKGDALYTLRGAEGTQLAGATQYPART